MNFHPLVIISCYLLSMKKHPRPSPAELPLSFEVDPEPATEILTALAGIPLLLQACRALRVPASVNRHLKLKLRDKGLDEPSMVESFIVLNAAGAECVDDFLHLSEDKGLAELIGHPMPTPSAARRFLLAFHDDENIDQAKQLRLPDQIAYIPAENQHLSGLALVNRDLIAEFGKKVPVEKIATVDQDATIIESSKQQAMVAYTGERGYQPMLALWAETDLILTDQFRDGNVPASMDPLEVAKVAFANLPPSVQTYYYRGDSACHESQLIKWLADQKREDGPQGPIYFAISARMSVALRETIISQVNEESWLRYGDEQGDVIQQCADVVFVSNEEAHNKLSQPLRYVAIRISKRQGELFADGSAVKYFALLSNIWEWGAVKLVNWHRQKAGTIEKVNDVLKNEYAAGVLPSGKFGANAAWLRLAVITHNLVTGLKRLALPEELLEARPKRLRFLIFNRAGRIVHHARKTILRIASSAERISRYWEEGMKSLAT